MKFLAAEFVTTLGSRRGRRNVRVLSRFLIVLAAMIILYAAVFHLLMELEGQHHSWLTGVYWTLTVMSTLGFGDITFHTDIGRGFSILVLLSGMVYLLVLMPVTFIEFFYQPWMQAQESARAPRELPQETRGHVLLTNFDAVTQALIRRLDDYQYAYALVTSDLKEALRIHDLGLRVVLGNLDDPDTWRRLRVEKAALVASTASDVTNTSVASTIRGVDEWVPIISTATREASVDILKLAGSHQVLRLEVMLGQSFARRTIGGDALAHVIGNFDDILIAEAMTHGTPLVGKSLDECEVMKRLGVDVVGVWERGTFMPARAETRIGDNTVLVLAGTQESLDRYNEFFIIYNVSIAPVVILGGGRVGRATARSLADRGVDYRIVEIVPERVPDDSRCIVGDAADLEVLERAGLPDAPTVIITTHDDETNVYLTVYCRQLQPDIQIISRSTLERNVATLHRAGADMVMSYASMGASSLMNLLRRSTILMVAEGLDIFRVRVPPALADKTIAELAIRQRTGCSVVGIRTAEDIRIIPGADEKLPPGAEILVIGSFEAEQRFLELFGDGNESTAWLPEPTVATDRVN